MNRSKNLKKYNLVGINGNAFNIMAYVTHAMRQEGKCREAISQYTDNTTSGDYENLLRVSQIILNELNSKYEETT